MAWFGTPTFKGFWTAIVLFIPFPVFADDTSIKDRVFLELNAVRSTEEACTFTFQVVNGHGSQITKAIYEAVLFDDKGQVDRLTLFDFGALPPGRPRVRQFAVQGVSCDGLGRLLINGAQTCDSDGLAPEACEADLELNTRTEIEVVG